jgi:transcriptional regulator with XRE-family HTH domain
MDIHLQQKENIGKITLNRRKSRHVIQGDLADIAGISHRNLRNIEKGHANPDLETLMRICNVLEIVMKSERSK